MEEWRYLTSLETRLELALLVPAELRRKHCHSGLSVKFTVPQSSTRISNTSLDDLLAFMASLHAFRQLNVSPLLQHSTAGSTSVTSLISCLSLFINRSGGFLNLLWVLEDYWTFWRFNGWIGLFFTMFRRFFGVLERCLRFFWDSLRLWRMFVSWFRFLWTLFFF